VTTPASLPDVNVLLALVSEDHEHHIAAHTWFRAAPAWATTPVTETGLIRLIMNPVVVGSRISSAVALDVLRRLRRQGDHRFVADESSLLSPAIDLTALVGHRQVTDLHLVNLCAGAGCVLTTFDARLAAALDADDRHHVSVLPV
jgi:toxin-antitoxin system PIN domain toxin